MRIHKLILILYFFFWTFTSFALVLNPDKKKTDETASTINTPQYAEGLVYSLPRTGIIVHVETEKTSFKPGPYNQYAQKYLGISNAGTTEKVNWQITAVNMELFSEADPDALFKTLDSMPIPISTLPNGIITSINGNGVESSSSIIGSDFIVKKDQLENVFSDLSSDDFYELLLDGSGTETMKFKSIEEKAKEAANYIIRLRKKRAYAILDPSDVIPEDGRGYEVFVREANKLDKEYMALFTGKNFSSKQEFSFIFFPGQANVKNEILFRFSEEKGILPKTDISGKPILLAVTKENSAYDTGGKLKVSLHPNAGNKGIFYRIPVGATLTLSDGLQTLYQGQASIAQFGVIAPIPENLLNGNNRILYNTETGSIKSIHIIE